MRDVTGNAPRSSRSALSHVALNGALSQKGLPLGNAEACYKPLQEKLWEHRLCLNSRVYRSGIRRTFALRSMPPGSLYGRGTSTPTDSRWMSVHSTCGGFPQAGMSVLKTCPLTSTRRTATACEPLLLPPAQWLARLRSTSGLSGETRRVGFPLVDRAMIPELSVA